MGCYIATSLGIFMLLWILSAVHGHAILTNLQSRTGPEMSFEGDGNKIATFPPTPQQLSGCLSSTPLPPRDTFTAGSQVELKWNITIPHASDPGVRVALQYPGESMLVLADNIDVNTLSTTVNLPPDKISESAVLQWMWASQEDGGFYMACSDIRIGAPTLN